MSFKTRTARTVFLAAIVGVCGTGVRADEEDALIRRSVIAYKFLTYTSWPAGAFPDHDAPVVLAVIGKRYAFHLRKIVSGERIDGRAIVIREVVPPPDRAPEDEWGRYRSSLDGVHALFVGAGHGTDLTKLLDAVKGREVLTIGDGPDFASDGGMLGLVQRSRTIDIEANLDAIKGTSIRLSSKLLGLAKIVQTRAIAG